MKYPVSQAAKIVGVTRQTLYRHIKSKSISTEIDETGAQVIEASELIRIYGDKLDFGFDQPKPAQPAASSASQDATTAEESLPENVLHVTRLEFEVGRLKDLLHKTEAENDYIKSLLEEERAERKKANNLLEDMRTKTTTSSNWEKAITVLERRISNQDQMFHNRLQREKRMALQNKTLKRELEEERAKTFWKRLFG